MKQAPPIMDYNDKNMGFTLIELMLVIAVISVLAIVSVPKYQAITDHYKLESSAQIVVGQLRYAKQLSMDQRKDIYVAMDTHTVEVLGASNKEYGGLQTFDSGVKFDVSSAASNGLTIDSKARGLAHVAYDPQGFLDNPSSGAVIKIVLSTVRTGRSLMIVVQLQTGDIAVEW